MPNDAVLRDIAVERSTPRMLMRIPRPGDGAIINPAVVDSVAELAPWMPWATPTPTIQDTELWCRQSAAKFLTRELIHYTLLTQDGAICIGGCGFNRIDWTVPMAEMGYWLRTSFCGKGLMTEAVNALTGFGFDELKMQRLEIRCDERNLRSAAVAERAGYKLEGLFHHDALDPKRELRNTRIYATLPS